MINAAILFFGKEPDKHFPLYGVKIATFKGNEIQDITDFRGNIFNTVEPVIEYISSKTPQRLFFDKATRYEKPLVPKEVLREAVINALIHRDYSTSSSIFIKITEDEIEIKNPGMLPAPLEITSLYQPHESRPRNPLLAELANKAKMIEHWGSGTLRIISEMRKSGLADPVFSQERGYFTVTLPLREISLNKRQEKILSHIKLSRNASLQELHKIVKGSYRTLHRDLDELVNAGLLFKAKTGRHVSFSLSR